MKRNRDIPSVGVVVALAVVCLHLAWAQYGGGTGEPNDPYQIWTAEQMNAIGADPNQWTKCFILMADLDLSGYDDQNGRPAFNVIGAKGSVTIAGRSSGGPTVRCVFDGNGHTISNLTLNSERGLFASLNDPNACVKNLTLLRPTIKTGTEFATGALVGALDSGSVTNCLVVEGAINGIDDVGGLVGYSHRGKISDCNITGVVTGRNSVGGLIGGMGEDWAILGSVTNCHAVNGVITGTDYVGGLAGRCSGSTMTQCSATGVVTGRDYVGGLVGTGSTMAECYSAGVVTGRDNVGGLVGSGSTTRCFAAVAVVGRHEVGGLAGSGGAWNCYATGAVLGDNFVGGLIGTGATVTNCCATGLVALRPSTDSPLYIGGLVANRYAGTVTASFWNIETSGQGVSGYGEGKTTAQMQTTATFLDWGKGNNAGVWTIDEGHDYPHLAWEQRPGMAIGPLQFSDLAVGTGTSDDPYLISTVTQLYFLTQAPAEWSKCFKLTADLDLGGYTNLGFSTIGTWEHPFTGFFDGNGHTISRYVNACPSDHPYDAGLFGRVRDPNQVRHAPSSNVVMIKNLGLINPLVTGQAGYDTGALVGYLANGVITGCYVEGGLVFQSGSACDAGGGLVGYSHGTVRDCFASIKVVSGGEAGGLVGYNEGAITNCYSTGLVYGALDTGGLAGLDAGSITASFWDIETSQLTENTYKRLDGKASGTGLTTAQMHAGSTFLIAGWDFVGETANGTADIWRIEEGKGYPRLWWQKD